MSSNNIKKFIEDYETFIAIKNIMTNPLTSKRVEPTPGYTSFVRDMLLFIDCLDMSSEETIEVECSSYGGLDIMYENLSKELDKLEDVYEYDDDFFTTDDDKNDFGTA